MPTAQASMKVTKGTSNRVRKVVVTTWVEYSHQAVLALTSAATNRGYKVVNYPARKGIAILDD